MILVKGWSTLNSQNEFEYDYIEVIRENRPKKDWQRSGWFQLLCSGSVTKFVVAVEVNNTSKSDSIMYDRKITLTGRELVNSMCFASDFDTKSDPALR